jgi:Asp-tRNA(Asn)/Glu-tRNA(Gln) amidotransferase A subunit family amidase
MDATELCFTPAGTLARAIRAGEISPVEVVDAVLARIEAVNPRINAYCTVAAEPARDAARAAEERMARGGPLGPLHGIPVSFKDLTPTAGIRTTMGSKIFAHSIPAEDALIVQRVKAAGAVVVGKTNTPEFGCKGVTDNRVFGATRNPWNPAIIAGGSSGGAGAALAAGLAPLAEGSDLAGSIRIPAAACGVVGLKPGWRAPARPRRGASGGGRGRTRRSRCRRSRRAGRRSRAGAPAGPSRRAGAGRASRADRGARWRGGLVAESHENYAASPRRLGGAVRR